LKLVNVLRVQKQTTIKETLARTDVVLRKDSVDINCKFWDDKRTLVLELKQGSYVTMYAMTTTTYKNATRLMATFKTDIQVTILHQ